MTTCRPMGAPALDLGIWAGGGRIRLVLGGELDAAGVPAVDALVRLVARAGLPLHLDCGALTFVDAAGVGALVRAVHGGGTVDATSVRVRRVLDVLGLTELITGSDPGPATAAPPLEGRTHAHHHPEGPCRARGPGPAARRGDRGAAVPLRAHP